MIILLVDWLVVFYGMSTIVPNPVYTYDFKMNSLLITFF